MSFVVKITHSAEGGAYLRNNELCCDAQDATPYPDADMALLAAHEYLLPTKRYLQGFDYELIDTSRLYKGLTAQEWHEEYMRRHRDYCAKSDELFAAEAENSKQADYIAALETEIARLREVVQRVVAEYNQAALYLPSTHTVAMWWGRDCALINDLRASISPASQDMPALGDILSPEKP